MSKVPKKRKKPGHLWKPGQSGNPGGRSKQRRELVRIIRDELESGEHNKAVRGIIDIATDPGAKDADRLRAWELLLAYGYGKPQQSIDLEMNAKAEVAAMPWPALAMEAVDILRREVGEAELIRLLNAPPTGAVIDAELDGADNGVEGSRRGASGAGSGRGRGGKKRGADQ